MPELTVAQLIGILMGGGIAVYTVGRWLLAEYFKQSKLIRKLESEALIKAMDQENQMVISAIDKMKSDVNSIGAALRAQREENEKYQRLTIDSQIEVKAAIKVMEQALKEIRGLKLEVEKAS